LIRCLYETLALPALRKAEGLGGNLWRAAAFIHRELIKLA
jgi:hypothetical protein